MDSETGTEIERQGGRNIGMETGTGDRDRYRQTWTEGQGQKYGKGQRDRDGRTGMEGQE